MTTLAFDITGGVSRRFLDSVGNAERALDRAQRQYARLNQRVERLRNIPNPTERQRRDLEATERAVVEAREEVERLDSEMGRLRRRQTVFRGLTVAAGALAGALAGTSLVVGGVVSHFDELNRVGARTGVNTAELARADIALRGIGVAAGEGAELLGEFHAELNRKLGEGVDTSAFGVDAASLFAGVEGATARFERALAATEQIAATQGAEAAYAFTEALIGGVEGSTIAAIATRGQGDQVRGALEGAVSEETLERIAELSRGVNQLSGDTANLAAAFAGGLAPAIMPVVMGLATVAGWVGNALETWPALAPILVGVLAVALGLVSVQLAVMAYNFGVAQVRAAIASAAMVASAVKNAVAWVTSGGLIAAAGVVASAAWLPFIAVGLAVVAGVAAVVAAGVLLVRNWETVQEVAGRVFGGMKLLFLGYAEVWLSVVGAVVDGVNLILKAFSLIPGVNIEIPTAGLDSLTAKVRAERQETQEQVFAPLERRNRREERAQQSQSPQPVPSVIVNAAAAAPQPAAPALLNVAQLQPALPRRELPPPAPAPPVIVNAAAAAPQPAAPALLNVAQLQPALPRRELPPPAPAPPVIVNAAAAAPQPAPPVVANAADAAPQPAPPVVANAADAAPQPAAPALANVAQLQPALPRRELPPPAPAPPVIVVIASQPPAAEPPFIPPPPPPDGADGAPGGLAELTAAILALRQEIALQERVDPGTPTVFSAREPREVNITINNDFPAGATNAEEVADTLADQIGDLSFGGA